MRNSDVYDSKEYKGYTIDICYDSVPQNPWDDLDGLADIDYFESYNFGSDAKRMDKYMRGDVDAIIDYFDGYYFLPFTVYNNGDCHECDIEDAEAFLSVPKNGKNWNFKDKADAMNTLKSNLQLLSDYFTGNVFGFITYDPQGDEIDSCWGYYGDSSFDNLLSDAEDVIDHEIKKEMGREDREFDEFWEKRGDISDSTYYRRVRF